MPKKWFPLESNPEVMADYMRRLGADGKTFEITDVFGFDEDLLAMVPQPVKAVMLLYPISDESDKAVKACAEVCKAQSEKALENGLWYTHQTVSNACGTIALVHAAVNAVAQGTMELDDVADSVWLRDLIKATTDMTPADRARYIEESDSLENLHGSAANQGQSHQEDINAEINLHFVTFVCHQGQLWELDGRAPGPILRSENCPPEAILTESAKVIQNYIKMVAEKNPENALMFAATALL